MKRYHFSLEAVLRVRRAQEEAAGFALAHANQQRQKAMVALQEALTRCQALSLQPGSQDHLSFQRERAASERRAEAVSLAQHAVDVATDEATARLADWSAAAKLVAAVERLDDRRREEWRLEEQRVELAAIDESALAGWLADTAATASAPAGIGVGT
jgi:flagellar export protein FliJ